MKLTQMTKYVELDKVRLIEYLRLLKSRGLIGKEVLGENNILYFVTERGLKVLKVTSPIVKEAHKIQMHNFEAISNALNGVTFPPEIQKEESPKWKVVDFIKEKRPKWKLSDFIKIEIVEEEND
ncbi:hypothetical protein MUO71_08590 [Candidatus Bathyarchaeota archaeon]|nr:hypothetical protein [Candidatus Bathyarchaeota archaeon]